MLYRKIGKRCGLGLHYEYYELFKNVYKSKLFKWLEINLSIEYLSS